MPNPILIVHGWSDNYKSFVPLQEWVQSRFGPAIQVFFVNYASMEDHVTFDDLAAGLQDRLDDLRSDGKIALDPFSIDVIVHSTGGPVIRHWLYNFLVNAPNRDITRCPIRRFIMLAPANFGSRLAAAGKTALAKLFKGGVSKGFETGELILDGLELGSPDLWKMAEDDLFFGKSIFPCVQDKGPFAFVFSGTRTYGELKGLVAPGANEDGSDGTVRASAASLNSIKIDFDCSNPAAPQATIARPANARIAFRLVPNVNHTEIVPREKGDFPSHPTCALIERCMAVNSYAEYTALSQAFEQENAGIYTSLAPSGLHAYQQFVFHVCDELGNDVLDYRIDFHVVDSTITTNEWAGNHRANLEALQRYADETNFLQQTVIANVETHTENSSYRTFFVNINNLRELQNRLSAMATKPYIAMNLDAAGPTKDLGYNTDSLHYVRVDKAISDGKGGTADFFFANTTTLVEIKLLNVPTTNVIKVFPPPGPDQVSEG
ncbi:MAG TPA: hypothetical protein VEG64_06705 [Candidatus Sulfotelmatobacter sp.]|nr:hypothetical protein [Candidatus Sulfotelmatobacter sp.]